MERKVEEKKARGRPGGHGLMICYNEQRKTLSWNKKTWRRGDKETQRPSDIRLHVK